MAAALAEGETQIENAAREPEITDLAELLIKMGAEIEGAGTSTIRVRGKKKLHGARHTIIPDRIEAGTFLVAGAITNGALELTGCAPEHLTSVIAKLRETGVEIRETGSRHAVRSRREKAGRRRRQNRGISRLCHGHAGAVHGAGHAGRRHFGDHRKQFSRIAFCTPAK